MPAMTSPKGKTRDIPDAGVAALKALGWTLTEDHPATENTPKAPASRKKRG